MKLGDTVLIWGASGGLGSYATQLALAAGATPVCVVSSPAKADICKRMGAELVLDRTERGYRFWKDEHTQDPKEWKRLGADIRELTGGRDVDIKRIVGSHFANYAEAWAANDLIRRGLIHPTLSRTYALSAASQAASDVYRNLHQGKVGVVCLAPGEGLGVREPELRARHLEAIMRFRDV
jgi:crotonyl-CoA reductase